MTGCRPLRCWLLDVVVEREAPHIEQVPLELIVQRPSLFLLACCRQAMGPDDQNHDADHPHERHEDAQYEYDDCDNLDVAQVEVERTRDVPDQDDPTQRTDPEGRLGCGQGVDREVADDQPELHDQ